MIHTGDPEGRRDIALLPGDPARVERIAAATFYPGQERSDSFSQYIPKSLQGTKGEWQLLGMLNYEMEAATLSTMCSALGLRAGCVSGVVDTPSAGAYKPGESSAC
jgi:uridine phosphorylase